MPEHHQGLLSFQFNAKALIEENFGGDNILELALEALESKRGNSVDKIINMPAFKIDSNIEATDILRMVLLFSIFHIASKAIISIKKHKQVL